MTISLFEAIKTTRQALVRSLTNSLDKYGLRKKIHYLCQNEGFNINAMTIALESIASCESLGLEELFQRTSFGHGFSKVCQ